MSEAAAFLSFSRTILESGRIFELRDQSRLAELTSPEAIRDMIAHVGRCVVEDAGSLFQRAGNVIVCHQEQSNFVSYRRYPQQSDYLYLSAHTYVEVVLSAPDDAILKEYRAVSLPPDALKLHGDFQATRLELVREAPCVAGQVVVKKTADQVLDWSHVGELRTLKAVFASPLPYELLFSREVGQYIAALESTFRSSMLRNAIDLLALCGDIEDDERIAELTFDHDPLVAWRATQILHRKGSDGATAALQRFSAGDVGILARAAQRALGEA